MDRYQLKRQRFEDNEFNDIEILGQSEVVDSLILKEPNANIFLQESDGTNLNFLSASNTVDRVNVGSLEKNISFATNKDPEVIKNFGVSTVSIYENIPDQLNTNILSFIFNADFAEDCDGFFFDKLILDTNIDADYTRIEIREDDENGDIIYENIAEIAFNAGDGDPLISNKIALSKFVDIACSDNNYWLQIQTSVNIIYQGETTTEFKPFLSLSGKEYVTSKVITNRSNVEFERLVANVVLELELEYDIKALMAQQINELMHPYAN